MSNDINQLHQSLSLMSIDDSGISHKNAVIRDLTNAKSPTPYKDFSRNSVESYPFEDPQFNEIITPNRQDSFSDDESQFVESCKPIDNAQRHDGQENFNQMNNLVPVVITWDQGGNSVFVTGSFTDWRKMIALESVENTGNFAISLKLPVGNHRFRFIVDGELRISDSLPQATDHMGNFVNFLEILSPFNTPSSQNTGDSFNTIKPVTSANTHSNTNDFAGVNSNNNRSQFINKNKFFPGMTSIEKEEEASRRREEDQSHMSKSSRIALQIARENDSEPIDIGNGYERVPAEIKGPILGIQDKPEIHVAENNNLNTGNEKNKVKKTKQHEYTHEIPAVFTDPQVMEQYYLTLDQQRNNQQYMSWLTPPQLPPHLEKVILNSHNKHSSGNGEHAKLEMSEELQKEKEKENTTGALPIPNHVVLNHLITSSIKHNTLCVASSVRYKKKYVTQILYAPL
ncbi:hypothetical protein QEN19_001181 [Hanseniaspora menglaensis]